jgi:hypothetical protein
MASGSCAAAVQGTFADAAADNEGQRTAASQSLTCRRPHANGAAARWYPSQRCSHPSARGGNSSAHPRGQADQCLQQSPGITSRLSSRSAIANERHQIHTDASAVQGRCRTALHHPGAAGPALPVSQIWDPSQRTRRCPTQLPASSLCSATPATQTAHGGSALIRLSI